MPQSRIERAIFIAGIAVFAILVVLIVRARQATTVAPQVAETSPSPTGTTSGTMSVARTTEHQRSGSASPLRLQLAAVGGSSSVLVRSNSESGRVLFTGILDNGEAISVDGARLWVRVGTPEHLRARLNGKMMQLGPARSPILITLAGTIRLPGD